MTSPSSGVKPMVVSTLRPPRTAASDDPAPRWQVPTRPGRVQADDLGGVGHMLAEAADTAALGPAPGQ